MTSKRELDKESMFRKIMPSSGQPGGEPMAEAAILADTAIVSTPVPSSEVAQPAVAASPAGSAPGALTEPAAELASEPAPTEPAPAPETLEQPLEEGEKPYPINMAELVAEAHYARYQKRMNGCYCQRCKDDVLGITLNKVQPRYVASDRLNPAELNNRVLVTETVTALIRAILMVKKNPHHDERDLMRQ